MVGSRLAFLCLVSFTVAASAQGGPVIDPKIRREMEQPVKIALAKLESRECLSILADFKDPAGNTLEANLSTLGITGSAYMSMLAFYSGTGLRRCDKRTTVVSTSPGSRAVFVCQAQFREVERQDTGYAANLLVHEMLHSLGLAENPPTSTEITEKVIERCGR
jgi:hypothetical protein